MINRFATDKATIWTPIGQDNPNDPFSNDTWERCVIDVCKSTGGKTQRDEDGAEFEPSSTYWTATELRRGMKIVDGEVESHTPPSSAKTIRKADSWTPLRNQPREYAGFTG